MSYQESTNNTKLETSSLNIGFIPLTDCAVLAVAKEKGLFEKNGLDVNLSKEASWANIRDKLAYGILDGAQMLATMPITASLGVGGWRKDTVTAFVMGLNGNAITVSTQVYNELKAINPGVDASLNEKAETLKQLVEIKKEKGEKKLNFAHVFPSSTHNYFLRYWLASAGINPDEDVNLSVIPPQQMVKNLEAGIVDGFCVGEPWNQYAVQNGHGVALITSYEIWNNAPDKVLGVNRDWAYRHPNTHKALIKSLIEAASWADEIENRDEVAEILSREEYINVPVDIISKPLNGKYIFHPGTSAKILSDFNVFYRYAACFPWHSHAAWYIEQMSRWGDLPANLDTKNIIKDIYWVDFYRETVSEMGLDAPVENHKTEGEHTGSWEIPSLQGTILMSSDKYFANT